MMAQSQATYPNRAIKLVVPYSAGGLPDTVARIFAQQLQDRLGQSVVVDNKPGANGVVAASMASALACRQVHLPGDRWFHVLDRSASCRS